MNFLESAICAPPLVSADRGRSAGQDCPNGTSKGPSSLKREFARLVEAGPSPPEIRSDLADLLWRRVAREPNCLTARTTPKAVDVIRPPAIVSSKVGLG